jgi:hypothetical protein
LREHFIDHILLGSMLLRSDSRDRELIFELRSAGSHPDPFAILQFLTHA